MQKQTCRIRMLSCAGGSSRSGNCEVLTLAPDPSPIVANERFLFMIGSLWPHSPVILAASTVCSVFTGVW